MTDMGESPKSAFELAMERLKAEDRVTGHTDVPLDDVAKEKIAESRRLYGSRLAEREILFQDALKRANDPEARRTLEAEYRMDRSRIEADRERAIEKIRLGGRC
jgi:hypothetical protein